MRIGEVFGSVGQLLGSEGNVPGTEFDTNPQGVHIARMKTRILHSHRCRRNAQLDVTGHHLEELLLIDVIERVEIGNFRRQFRGQVLTGVGLEKVDPGATGGEIVPEGFFADANRRDDSDSGNDNPCVG